MSYTSENVLSKGTTLKQVREVISLLGYVKVQDGLKIPNRTDGLMWFSQKDYQSWVGVELDVYREKGQITVSTRSRAGRSYWDLIHQNKTIKLLRDLFGGYFDTDEGRNRYWKPDGKPPSPIMSGCFLARWRFNNALIKPKLYFMQREMKGQIAQAKPTGHDFIDEFNIRFFSNNLVLPYLVGIWEEYFKSSFIVLLQYSKHRSSALKRARLTQEHLEAIAAGEQNIEQSLAETLSFQRPSKVAANFKLVDPKIDIATTLRKPYRRRKIPLYDSIESCVEMRNEMVHTGRTDTTLTDKKIKKIINDFEVAVDRVYDFFGKQYNFHPSRDF